MNQSTRIVRLVAAAVGGAFSTRRELQVHEFARPVTLPAGTAVRVEATWDNSTKNRYNPRPDQETYWGEQSWDEMFSPILRAVVQLKSPIIPTPPMQVQVSRR